MEIIWLLFKFAFQIVIALPLFLVATLCSALGKQDLADEIHDWWLHL